MHAALLAFLLVAATVDRRLGEQPQRLAEIGARDATRTSVPRSRAYLIRWA
jgi:hypothetical protein